MSRARVSIALCSAVLACSGPAAGQERPAAAPDSSCTYAVCGLAIAPTLTGLDVVRGAAATRVGSLGFFRTADLRPVFTGNDSAQAYARRAFHTRKTASIMTDLGLLALAAGVAQTIRDRDIRRDGAVWAAGGVALLGLSFPLQLRADAHLSRAVWWYNSRFTGR